MIETIEVAPAGGDGPDEERSREELEARCLRLRAHIESRGLAETEELGEAWPDPPAQARRDAWWECYAQLMRFIGRSEVLEPKVAAADRVAMAAIMEEPVPCLLSAGDEVGVYPKGLKALLWFRAEDWMIGWLGERRDLLRESVDAGTVDTGQIPQPRALLREVEDEIAAHLARLVVQATSPGPALVEADAAKHAWAVNLAPTDVLRIHVAFLQANGGRLQALEYLVKPPKKHQGRRDRASWSQLVSAVAERTRQDPVKLAESRSIVGMLMQMNLSAPSLDDLT